MKNFKVKIDPQAIADINSIAEWYDQQQSLLGDRFLNTIIKHINKLENTPYSFAIRYNEIRCMSVTKFPFMVHFIIDEKQR